MSRIFGNITAGNIISIVVFLAVLVTVLVIFLTVRAKIKRFFRERRKDKELLEKLRVDTIPTDMLTRDDIHAWFDGFLKKGQRGVMMTEQALKAKNNDIEIPSCPAGSRVFYLAVYLPDKDETVRQRFIVTKQVEPELTALIDENGGVVVFEA